MLLTNCCKAMEMELAAWKATVYDIVRKMDKMPGGVKQNFLNNIEDLHILIEELDQRIENIRANCTPEKGIDDIKTERIFLQPVRTPCKSRRCHEDSRRRKLRGINTPRLITTKGFS